jgi:hypothetical protein
MNLFKTRLAAFLLGSLAVGALGGNAFAQTWQPVRPADDAAAPANDWEQRVLKRPQPQQQQPQPQSLRWQSGQSMGGPSGRAQDQAGGQDSMVIQAAATSPVDQPASPRPATRSYQTARRNAFDNVFDDAVPREPAAMPVGQRTIVGGTEPGGPEVLAPGAMRLDPLMPEAAFVGPGGCNHCGAACDGEPCDGPACGCGGPACCSGDMGYEIFDGSCGWWIKNLTVSAGAQGFKGPLDRGGNGDFGLNEGVGFSGPVGDPWNVGYQIGANFLQSNFIRPDPVTLDTGETFRASSRDQAFVTAGIFRRALCGGLQGGVAYDYLHDNYYVQYDLQQIRSDISWVFPCCEIGYYGAYGVSTARPAGLNEKLAPTDMFTVYVRHQFENGGEGRIWGGATGNGDGILGGELWIPLGRGFALENRVNFLIPNSTPTSVRDNSGQERESWGLMIQLVWYPGRSALCQQRNPYRPLFSTADDSLFMVDRLVK